MKLIALACLVGRKCIKSRVLKDQRLLELNLKPSYRPHQRNLSGKSVAELMAAGSSNSNICSSGGAAVAAAQGHAAAVVKNLLPLLPRRPLAKKKDLMT
jgi:hypothetical protein